MVGWAIFWGVLFGLCMVVISLSIFRVWLDKDDRERRVGVWIGHMGLLLGILCYGLSLINLLW